MGPEKREIFNAFWIAIGFVGAVLAYFLFHMFKKQRELRILQQEKMNAEFKAVEIERNQIATMLHNDIGPALSGVRMRLNLIDTNDAEMIKTCTTVLDQTVLQIRNMSQSLAPLGMIQRTYRDALMQYIEKIGAEAALKIDYIDQSDQTLPVEANNQVYRILQEIIQNTVKHAAATRLLIEITAEGQQLLIRTADDGIGFNEENFRANNQLGMGLLNIRSRVDFLKGTISSPSNNKKGTQYNIRIPLNT